MARFVTKVVIALVAIVFVSGLALVTYVHSWQTRPQTLPQEVVVEFKGGTGLTALAKRLSESAVIDNSTLFTLMVRLGGEYKHYQAGTYRFSGQVTTGRRKGDGPGFDLCAGRRANHHPRGFQAP